MKLFLITQDLNKKYDTFDSAVVAAIDEDDARKIHPMDISLEHWEKKGLRAYEWVSLSQIQSIEVEYLGETEKERGVICASFNAG